MNMTKSIDVFLSDGCGRCSKFGTDACSVRRHQAEIQLLRRLAKEVFEEENMKWGSPCYSYKNKNVVILHSFKDFSGFTFFKGALLSDPEKILIQQTENMHASRMLRCTNLAELIDKQDLIKAYLFEALEIEKAGLKVAPKPQQDLIFPEELIEIFKSDEHFKKAFHCLTPGRQKNYVRHFSEAKQAATRTARIEKYKPFILKGIGMEEAWKMK